MLKGKELVDTLVAELVEIGVPVMAEALENLYSSPDFLEMDRLTLISKLVSAEYDTKVSRRLNTRLKTAKLIGCPAEIENCVDSDEREYRPSGISDVLSSLDFIDKGYNLCVLGASDVGKTYFAKALGVVACRNYKVQYHHCEDVLDRLSAEKTDNRSRYERRLRALIRSDLVILDDFLLHAIADEEEAKILFTILENRLEQKRSTIICSQRDPENWKAMIMDDEVSANAILKRATKHYTVMIKAKTS